MILRLEERKAMKASKFSDTQKAFILKQGDDGVPVAEDLKPDARPLLRFVCDPRQDSKTNDIADKSERASQIFT
jgi:hypothetical protein